MTSIITTEEIQAIFDEADRLKSKGGGGGGGGGVEAKVSAADSDVCAGRASVSETDELTIVCLS